ncbi:MAG: hypothetical protein Q9221_003106 [Calogaya cf. arnoldii]
MSSNVALRFLKQLPGEIRSLIYHHLFASTTVKTVWTRPSPGPDGIFLLDNPHDRSILATCRKFRTQAFSLFWKDAHILLQISEADPRAGINAFVTTIRFYKVGLIENLSLYRGPKPYLTYNVPGTRPSVQMAFYRNLTQQFPKLKDDRIEHNEVTDYQWGGSTLNTCWAERVKDAAFLNEMMVLVQVKDIRTVHEKELVDVRRWASCFSTGGARG